MASDNRYRNFATIVYHESAPANWLDILNDLHIPIFVSPIHDKDLDKDGNIKKAHWHVLIMFAGKKSENSVKELVATFGGVGLEKIHDMHAYARYLCHLDDVDKVHYSVDDVLSFGGADYDKFKVAKREADSVIAEIIDFIMDNQGISFAYVVSYARYNRPDWFKVLVSSSSAFVVKEFMCSLRDSVSYDGTGGLRVFVKDKDNMNELFEKGGVK